MKPIRSWARWGVGPSSYPLDCVEPDYPMVETVVVGEPVDPGLEVFGFILTPGTHGHGSFVYGSRTDVGAGRGAWVGPWV